MKNHGLKIICFCFLSAILVACSNKVEPAYVKNPIVANLTEQQRNMLSDIDASGVQIIKQGMRFTFVLPVDCFFVKDTRILKTQREKAIDAFAQFIHDDSIHLAKPTVRISGYTDKTWLSPARDILSLHYAKTIAEYLREDGVSAHTIMVRGEGAKNPIASNQYPMGTAFNRRVEIILN